MDRCCEKDCKIVAKQASFHCFLTVVEALRVQLVEVRMVPLEED